MRIIKITEEQYRYFETCQDVFEGITYKNNGDGTLDFSVNQDRTDKGNTGGNSVDTRVFGTKDAVLNGDGTASKHAKTLQQQNDSKTAAIKFYQSVIDYVKNGRKGEIYQDPLLDKTTYTSVMKWFQNGYSDNRIIADATKSLNRIKGEADVYFNKYDRVNAQAQNPNDQVARYNVGTVPGTNVKYIALFSMTDFNFSDALKHGKLRQNGNTDELLGITKDQRAKTNGKSYQNINITYDGQYQPDVARNFSLNGVQQNGDHFKQQFGLNGEGGYTSVNQFLDKSVNYAAYALKQEGFRPNYLVAAPSSSKFNDYYCTNLANKLGIQYVKDFFARNVVNVRFDDGSDTEAMKQKGFSDKDIFEFSSQVKNMAFTEIAHIISKPMWDFVNQYSTIFSNISIQKNSREKNSLQHVFDCMMTYAYQVIVNNIQQNSNASDRGSLYLAKEFMKQQGKLQRSYDSQRIQGEVINRIKMKIGVKYFNEVLGQIQNLVLQYVDTLQTRGYKLQFSTKQFKITSIKKQFRPYLHHVYIIADKNMNKNGDLLSRYNNANFLIFDEDINSGATLKLVIEALQEKLEGNNNIMCLVNAYSASGF